MRHLKSILYASMLALAVWTLCSVLFTQGLTVRAHPAQSIEPWIDLLLLILAGAAYAILLLSRLSPAGPALAGLAYLGASGWALADAPSFQRLWLPEVSKEGFDLTLPAYGLAAMLAVPLLCTAFSARRWRRHERASVGAPSVGQPFARPAHPGTLLDSTRTDLPTVTDLSTRTDLPSGADETMMLRTTAPAEATQVVSTQFITPVRAPAGLTSVVGAEEPTAMPVDAAQVTQVINTADQTQVINTDLDATRRAGPVRP